MFLQAAAQPATNDATQSMIVFFGCIIFTLLLVFYIFVPVRVESGEEKTRLAYLYECKEVIYENLRDLSFEYKAGKLGGETYVAELKNGGLKIVYNPSFKLQDAAKKAGDKAIKDITSGTIKVKP